MAAKDKLVEEGQVSQSHSQWNEGGGHLPKTA
jgi:hypothetical protein